MDVDSNLVNMTATAVDTITITSVNGDNCPRIANAVIWITWLPQNKSESRLEEYQYINLVQMSAVATIMSVKNPFLFMNLLMQLSGALLVKMIAAAVDMIMSV